MFSETFSMVYFIAAILLFVFVAHFMAKKKGLNPVFWGVMGGVFGPLAILVLVFIKAKK